MRNNLLKPGFSFPSPPFFCKHSPSFLQKTNFMWTGWVSPLPILEVEKLGWLITGHPGCSNCLRDEQRSRPGQLKTSLGFLFDLLEKRHAIFSGITSCKNKIHWELLAANFAYKWDKPVWGTCWPEIKREHRRSRIQGEMEKISFASLWYHLHPGSNSAWSQPPGLP